MSSGLAVVTRYDSLVSTFFRGALAAFASAVGLCAALAHAAGPSPLPPLPGSGAAPPLSPGANATTSSQPAADAGAPADRTRRGVVVVERDGRALGVGTVLANDGRIVTSLAALAGSEQADVRYADGHTVKSKIGHRDTAWDLALLVPLSGRWTEGLIASEADPAATELRVMVPPRGKAALSPVTLKGRADARSRSGDPLASVLDLDLKGAGVAGAPVLDGAGSVVGVLVHACKTDAPSADGGAQARPCAPIVVGAPVFALRNFLVRTPLNAVAPAPWLGIVGAPDASGNVRGVRVMAIAPQSPAEKGGLKTHTERPKADLIAAVDGQPVESPEALAELISKHAVGEQVKLLVFGGDKFRELTVVLRAAP
jgi:serine protease Do